MASRAYCLLPLVAHLGLYRNEETLEPVVYYKKLPASLARHELIVLDPMLATGGTACAAISYLKERQAARLRFVCVLAAPEGVEAIEPMPSRRTDHRSSDGSRTQ